MANAGDVDGDGLSDLLLSAHYAGDGGRLSGTAYLWSGDAASGQHSLADADSVLTGEAASDYLSAVDGIGDLDEDGYDDVAIGATYNDSGAYSNSGATYVFYGPVTAGTYSVGLADAEIDGDRSSASMGAEHLSMDFDADGHPDFLASDHTLGVATSGRSSPCRTRFR